MAGSPIKQARRMGVDIPSLGNGDHGTVPQAIAQARARARSKYLSDEDSPETSHRIALAVLRDLAIGIGHRSNDLRMKAADALGKLTKREERDKGLYIEGLTGVEIVRLEIEARKQLQLPEPPTLATIDVEGVPVEE